MDSLVDSEGNFEFHGDGWLDDAPGFAVTTMTGTVNPAPLPPSGTVPCGSASVTFTGWNFPDGSPGTLQALCECAGALSAPVTFSCLSDSD